MNATMEVNFTYLLCGAQVDPEAWMSNLVNWTGQVIGDSPYSCPSYQYGVGIDYEEVYDRVYYIKGAGVSRLHWAEHYSA